MPLWMDMDRQHLEAHHAPCLVPQPLPQVVSPPPLPPTAMLGLHQWLLLHPRFLPHSLQPPQVHTRTYRAKSACGMTTLEEEGLGTGYRTLEQWEAGSSRKGKGGVQQGGHRRQSAAGGGRD